MSVTDFGGLKQVINNDLNRSDLVDVVADYVEDVIKELQREFFSQTGQIDTIQTVVGQAQYPTPADMMSIAWIRLNQNGNWVWLYKSSYRQLLLYDTDVVPTKSVPGLWAPWDDGFRLYPVPDLVYDLEVTGNGRLPVPATDQTSNFWTTEAAPLVRYLTLAKVYRIRIKNFEAAQQCEQEAERFRLALVHQAYATSTERQIAGHW